METNGVDGDVVRDSRVDYDTFVDWDKRLAREAGLFRRVFDEVGAELVVDVGAGSARHAIMFASWGLHVVAVDPDDSMRAKAHENVLRLADDIQRGGGSVTIVDAVFGELAERGVGPADALVCTGNALPHVDGVEGLRAALDDFAAVVRPGGALLLHLLNHERLISEQVRFIPPVVRMTPEGVKVFLRLFDYAHEPDRIELDFILLARDPSGAWSVHDHRSVHTALPVGLLRDELGRAGFEDVRAFGDHAERPLESTDESVIVVARCRSAGDAGQA
jgi:glycine/sarcosine N-methyltransferase